MGSRLLWCGLVVGLVAALAGSPALSAPILAEVLPIAGGAGGPDLAPPLSPPEVIYDNTTNFSGYFYNQGDGDIAGDEVNLAGNDRCVNHVDIQMGADTSLVADTTFRIYANDAGGAPGTLLYEQALGQVAYGGSTTLSIDLLANVEVPSPLTWTIELNNRTVPTGHVGPRVCDPPTVGSSLDDFWMDQGSGFALYWFGGSPVANFGARITAVPEPATMGLFGLGALFAAYRRRRR